MRLECPRDGYLKTPLMPAIDHVRSALERSLWGLRRLRTATSANTAIAVMRRDEDLVQN